MSAKIIDQVFSRWFCDAEFRMMMNETPELALADYNLSETEQQKLAHLSRKLRRQGTPLPAKSPQNWVNQARIYARLCQAKAPHHLN